jgi:hypothetical protein
MSYASAVLADSPISYYRLGESAGTQADDEQAVNHGTYVNTPTLGVAGSLVGDADTAVAFTGSQTEYVLCKTSQIVAGLTNWTVELWVKAAAPGSFDAMYCERHATAGGGMVRLAFESGKWKFTYEDSSAVQNTFTTTAASINNGAWHYLCVTKAGTAVEGYQDSSTSINSLTLTAGNGMTANMDSRIGADARDSGVYLDGTIDEVALYNTALSPTRIQVHLDEAASPSGGEVPLAPGRMMLP